MVVKIMVPVWVLGMTRHLVLLGRKKWTIILTTTHMSVDMTVADNAPWLMYGKIGVLDFTGPVSW